MFTSATATQLLSACRDINIGHWDSWIELQIAFQKTFRHSSRMGSQIILALGVYLIYVVFKFVKKYLEQERWTKHFRQPPRHPLLGIFLSVPTDPVGESHCLGLSEEFQYISFIHKVYRFLISAHFDVTHIHQIVYLLIKNNSNDNRAHFFNVYTNSHTIPRLNLGPYVICL